MHRLLRDSARHVSAEDLLSEASEKLPGVSLPTVYATLELFEQLGIVRRVNGGGGTLLWDTRADAHHHMICRSCGRIEDMEVPLDLERARRSAREVRVRAGPGRGRRQRSLCELRGSLATGLREVRLDQAEVRALRIEEHGQPAHRDVLRAEERASPPAAFVFSIASSMSSTTK